ncbi:hypothetical protein OKA06_14770 [Novosphingobium sp. MW5]|nr:hypothetical protein [Novosphingobium sp. MW5]
MTMQLMLTALFSTAALFAAAALWNSVRGVLPRLGELRAAAQAQASQTVSWRVTTVEVSRAPAQVRTLPVRAKALPVRSAEWRAAA